MPDRAPSPDADVAAVALARLEAHAAELETSPGWIARQQPIFWPEPAPEARPAHWSYGPIRAALEQAAGLVDLSLAERRILALRNPFPGNDFATTRTLSLSYQLMLPGEKAATHRHAPHALRILLDAQGTYSVVDGVRMPMESGDVVLTPGGCWHGHGHDGDRPACWIDALDIPLTHLLEPMFFEPWPGRFQPAHTSVQASPYRFTAAEIERRLAEEGPRIALAAPDVPTMGIAVEQIAAAAATGRRRSTASRTVVVAGGSGRSRIGAAEFRWQRGDVLAIPAWTWTEHRAESEDGARLVEVSDEPVMRYCGYYREEAA